MNPNQTNMYIVRFLSKAKLLEHIFYIAQTDVYFFWFLWQCILLINGTLSCSFDSVSKLQCSFHMYWRTFHNDMLILYARSESAAYADACPSQLHRIRTECCPS